MCCRRLPSPPSEPSNPLPYPLSPSPTSAIISPTATSSSPPEYLAPSPTPSPAKKSTLGSPFTAALPSPLSSPSSMKTHFDTFHRRQETAQHTLLVTERSQQPLVDSQVQQRRNPKMHSLRACNGKVYELLSSGLVCIIEYDNTNDISLCRIISGGTISQISTGG